MLEKLQEIISDFLELEKSFIYSLTKDSNNKESLLEYEQRFLKIKSDIRPIKAYVTKLWMDRDDKSATAIKFRIANAIMKGDFTDSDGFIFDRCSITQAEKLASASIKYKEFIEQRSTYKEALSNVADLRDDVSSYINLIKDRLK